MSGHDSNDAINGAIRQAAGRRGYPSAPRREPDIRAGDIGVGRGGACSPRRSPSRSEQINASLRDAFGVVRERITLADLWNA
jgi:hypothetical protein